MGCTMCFIMFSDVNKRRHHIIIINKQHIWTEKLFSSKNVFGSFGFSFKCKNIIVCNTVYRTLYTFIMYQCHYHHNAIPKWKFSCQHWLICECCVVVLCEHHGRRARVVLSKLHFMDGMLYVYYAVIKTSLDGCVIN